jgi:hypothetical protein
MEHVHHHRHDAGPGPQVAGNSSPATSVNRIALSATLHCLIGCAIGEVAGMVIGTALGWGNLETIVLALALAFVSGYALTVLPLLRHGYGLRSATRVALAADTASIAVMEIVDNALMWAIPGAMDAALDSWLFWAALAASLAVAAVAAFPINRWLVRSGRGHALAPGHH